MDALLSAVSGLSSMQQMLNVVGSNLSNSDTTGFKSTAVNFQQMYSQQLRGASAPSGQVGSLNPLELGTGVSIASMNQNFSEGSLNVTGNPGDLALNGNGFFVVQDNMGAQAYTRAGSFNLDKNSFLVNPQGLQVQGWQAQNGKIDTTQAVGALKIPVGRLNLAQTTNAMSMGGNLAPSSGPYSAGPPATGGQYSTEAQVYDSLGNSQAVTITFTNATPTASTGGQWNWSAKLANGTSAGSGQLVFNSIGQYVPASSTASPTIAFTPTDGSAPVSIAMDFTGVTQLATNGTYSVVSSSQNGLPPGVLQSYNVGADGIITGTFSNGLTDTLGRLAVANFTNQEGLSQGVGGLYYQTVASDSPQIGSPSENGASTITSGALESSNVNISTEFTDMIVAQRNFEANAKMITTMDQVLSDLTHLRSGM